MPFTQAGASTMYCFKNCIKLTILVLGCPLKTTVSISNFCETFSSGSKAEIWGKRQHVCVPVACLVP